MKAVGFTYDTYIESVIAFCETVDVVDVEWHDTFMVVKYN